MNKKIILLIISAVVLSNVLPVSSELTKNADIKTNGNDNARNIERSSKVDFAVMKEPTYIFGNIESTQKPISKPTPSEFSWIDNDGKNWVTPARNQRNCGSCWAFAAVASFESVIKIKEDSYQLDPDLSEQYILSCLPNAGSCRGGSSVEALELIKKTTPEGNNHNGVVTEECFQYYADDDIPCSDKCGDWLDNLVPLFDYGSWRSDGSKGDRDRIKTQIIEKGPAVAHIMATEAFKIWGSVVHSPEAYYFHFLPAPFINHVVIIVGWKDSPLVPNGGYWICKNSWGPDWGYEGFFNLAYGCLNMDRYIIAWTDYDPDSFNWPPHTDTGGPYGGYPNQEVIFDAGGSIGFEDEIVEYSWEFGDGDSGFGKTIGHTYQNVGKYIVKLTVTDGQGNSASNTTNIWIQETNNRPEKPSINGPSNGEVWRRYDYLFSSSDIDQNDLLYYIDWGDGKTEDWIGPFESDEEFTLSHRWTKNINGQIKVKVKDPYGEESEIETLNINMPRFRTENIYYLMDFLKNLFFLFK